MRAHILLLSMTLALASQVAESAEHSVTVTGTCQRSVVPDRSSIRLTAQAQDKDLKTATRDATRIYESTRDAVKKLSLEDFELTTAEYSVEEVREWENNRSVSKGFRARMGLEVSTSSVQKMGEVISIASREGIKDVGALVSFVSSAKMRKEQAACLEDAAKDARSRAEKLASALGVTVGTVASVSEAGLIDSSPMPKQGAMLMARAVPESGDMMPPPSVEPGKREINVSVRVEFVLN